MLKTGVRKAIEFVNPYVAGKTIEEVKSAYGLDEIIKLGSNENPYGPFTNAKQAMIDEVSQVFMYPDNTYEELKSLLAMQNGLESDQVAISHGAGGMLETLAKTFIEVGDDVIIPKQTYGLYREISKVMGGNIVESEVDSNYCIDLEDIISKVNDNTKLIWLCNPNNPTGTLMEEEKFEKLLSCIPKQCWIVMDEAYREFADESLMINSLEYIAHGANLIVVRTLSKAYGLAGVRIGYALADKEMIQIIDTVAEPFNANRIGLAGALATIKKDKKEYEEKLCAIITERDRVAAELKKLGMNCIVTHTNFIFFETGKEASALGEEFLKRGIIVRPCGGWSYPEAIRVTIGTPYENQRFLEEMKAVLNE